MKLNSKKCFYHQFATLVVQHDYYLSHMLRYRAVFHESQKNLLAQHVFYGHGWRGLSNFLLRGSESVIDKYLMSKRVLDSAVQGKRLIT